MSAFETPVRALRPRAPPPRFARQTTTNSQITAIAWRETLGCATMAPAVVAARTSFASPAHMSTAFAREVGLSPARYRPAFRPANSEAGTAVRKGRR
jgi:AraC-like DNA-binding protein